jgi:hypothetical protein
MTDVSIPRIDPADPETASVDCYRHRLDDGVEHYVAHLHDTERIVASLRIEPVRTAPVRRMREVGAPALPDDAGAYLHACADDDEAGAFALRLLMSAALAVRRRDAGDAFWLAGFEQPLDETARGLGWRDLHGAPRDARGRVPMVMLLDDAERLERIGSPLASAARAAGPDAARLAMLVDAFGLPADAIPGAEARRAVR